MNQISRMIKNNCHFKNLKRALFCAFTVFTSGCAVPTKKVILATQPQHVAVPGLRDWQNRATGTLRFFLVHGMNNHPFGFDTERQSPTFVVPGVNCYRHLFDGNADFPGLNNWKSLTLEQRVSFTEAAEAAQFKELIDAYSKRTHLEPTGKSEFFPIFSKTYPYCFGGYLLKRSFSDASGKDVVFYIASWSPSTAIRKESLYGSWDGETISGRFSDHDPFINKYRSNLNSLAKHHIVSWGLSDASIYVSNLGGELEEVLAGAIERFGEDVEKDDRAAVITASLGSTIMLNTISRLMNSDSVNGEKWRWRTDSAVNLSDLLGESDHGPRVAFYMFANQFALLSPRIDGELAGVTGGNSIESEGKALNDAVAAARESTGERNFSRIPLVAFSDPDDLLTYPMNFEKEKNIMVKNVYVRNNAVRYLLPVVGGVANPGQAHSGYESNRAVLDFMLSGSEE